MKTIYACVGKVYIADGRVIINNNGPDLINTAGILAIFYDGVMFTNLRFYVKKS